MPIKSYWPQKQAHARSANRDFGRRRFGNPLFRPVTNKGAAWHQRQHHQRRWNFITWRGIMALLFVAAVAYGLWYLLWSDTFRVRAAAVRVDGASPEVEVIIRGLIEQRLSQRTLMIFPQNNLLLLSGSGLKGDITDKIKLAKIDVSKKLPTGLVVTVTENEPKVVAAAGGKLFVADRGGVIIRELSEGESIKLGELPPELQSLSGTSEDTMVVTTKDLVTDEATTAGMTSSGKTTLPSKTATADSSRLSWPLVIREEERLQGLPAKGYGVGDNVLPPEAVQTVLDAEAGLAEACGTRAKWYTARPSGETVEASMAEGWSALLSTATPVSVQLSYLKYMLNKAIGGRRPDLIFIDVRYGEKIFAKFRDKAVTTGKAKTAPAR